ncbi:glycerol-3-phosphate 1-O-acyltransferase PlsY [Verticiella sediminum]|uniref:Glycerol-3-phosphate acyltransferase n=1 Tax=Verticiella sediminum TaxID=1247510 RepID=A0A556ADT2_9BURK|nr:glycerol-3-phosphate 1-O-acyltransferase PlsY [Verticiella sediminum]TSH91037.1 glycerol-3-phosphate 1-O-acyltransferase PlsY [Verticiella sediminum]
MTAIAALPFLPYLVLAVVAAYLLGSVPFAVLVSRLMRLQDPRSYGSGNPGATNVLRSGNKVAAALTLLGDAAKGWLAVWVALRWGQHPGGSVVPFVMLAVFLGHLYPVFLRFKGGKGVATALGVLLAVQPLLALATVATWLIVAVFLRISSLAALCAAVFAPLFYLFGAGVAWPGNAPIGVAIGLISLLLIYRHRANIERLLAGTEPRIGAGKKARAAGNAGHSKR